MTKVNKPPVLVSVIMNCYNSEKYLREAIDSVYRQTYPHWEIIFWDNHSNDQSASIAQSYDHRLRYFRGEKTVPLYAARNLALEKAQGDLIGFLDCDDLWMPEKLEKQVPLFQRPEVGVVFSDANFFHEEKILLQLYKTRPYATGNCFRHLLRDYFLCLPTVMIRRSALQDLPYPFDARFDNIGDADLFRRLSYQGYQLQMVDEVLAGWRVHGNNLTFRHPEKVAEETELMLLKYQELFPDFERVYQKELAVLKKNTHLVKAKILWKKGNSREARKILKTHWNNPKALLFWGLSFFPEAQCQMFLNLLKSLRTRKIRGAT